MSQKNLKVETGKNTGNFLTILRKNLFLNV